MGKSRILVAWSGGKDSTMTLYALRQSRLHVITALLTTTNEHYDRISMHGVRRTLLEQQAAALGRTVSSLRLVGSIITNNPLLQ